MLAVKQQQKDFFAAREQPGLLPFGVIRQFPQPLHFEGRGMVFEHKGLGRLFRDVAGRGVRGPIMMKEDLVERPPQAIVADARLAFPKPFFLFLPISLILQSHIAGFLGEAAQNSAILLSPTGPFLHHLRRFRQGLGKLNDHRRRRPVIAMAGNDVLNGGINLKNIRHFCEPSLPILQDIWQRINHL